MGKRHYDYRSIEPFKCNKKYECQAEQCFKYYMKYTDNDTYFSTNQTFKHIDYYYDKYKARRNMTASERSRSANYLLKKIAEIEYQIKSAFSIWTSIAVSLCVSIFIAGLQIQDNGTSFFDLFNKYILDLTDIFLVDVNVAYVLFYIVATITVIIAFSSGILVVFLGITAISIWFYKRTSYYRINIMPYERNAIIRVLCTYDSKFRNID